MPGTHTGSQTDLRMEATRNRVTYPTTPAVTAATGGGRGHPRNLNERAAPIAPPGESPTVRHRQGWRAPPGRRSDKTRSRPPWVHRRADRNASRPAPLHDGPRQPESHRQPPRGRRGFLAGPQTAGSPVDVRRLGARAARPHRQNYVRRYVFTQPRLPRHRAPSPAPWRQSPGYSCCTRQQCVHTPPAGAGVAGCVAGARQATR